MSHFVRFLGKSIFLSFLLGGCATTLPATIKPQPPLVSCTLTLGDIPDWPSDWATNGTIYAVQLLGIITDDRIVHRKEGECLDKLRKAQLIR